MNDITTAAGMSGLLSEYGTLLVFVNVLLVQLGLPIPAVPGLIIAGGLIAAGKLDPVLVMAAAVAASTLADYSWYLTGRRLGYPVLVMLCRLCLSPDLCVRQAETHYRRCGVSLLLFAKFMPGAAMFAPPLAGVLRMPRHLFLLYAGMGGSLWAGSYLALGYALDVQAHLVMTALERYGAYPALVAAAALATCVLVRLVQRRRSVTMFEARMEAAQVQQLLSAPHGAVLIDVRSALVRELDGRQLPGALVIGVNEVDESVRAIPKQSHLVIFCACPNEASSAHVAMRLRRRGYQHVCPLKDGIAGWAGAGLPVLAAGT